MLRHFKTNGLPICIAVVRPLGHPQGTHRNPGGTVQLWYFFFPVGEESCLVLETTRLDHGNIPTGFVRVSSRPSFFRTILFHFSGKFWYRVVAVHNFRWEGLFLINFMSFTQGFWMALFVTKHNPWGSTHEETNLVSQYENFRAPFINTNVFIFQNALGVFLLLLFSFLLFSDWHFVYSGYSTTSNLSQSWLYWQDHWAKMSENGRLNFVRTGRPDRSVYKECPPAFNWPMIETLLANSIFC